MTGPGPAVVTGAAGGIGKAVTSALDAVGHRVLAVDVRENVDPSAHAVFTADLTEPDVVEDLFRRIVERHGLPTVLVNNAGVYLARDLFDYTPEDYRSVVDGNLGSAFYCTQALARRVVAAGARASVVNVASVSGQSGSPDAVYGAAKGAVIALTRGLGRSLVASGIRVNAVAPGIIDTAMAATIPANRAERYRADIPVGHFGLPRDVAAAVRYLASAEESGYVTASVLDVNGGLR